MSEQRRIFVAVVLCLGIAFVWNWLLSSRRPPPVAPAAETAAPAAPTAPSAPGGSDTMSPAPSPTAGAPTRAAAAPLDTESFATGLYRGVLGSDAALHAFELLNYTEKPDADLPEAPVSLVTATLDGQKRQAFVRLETGAPSPALTLSREGDTLQLRGQDERQVATAIEVTPRAEQYALDYRLAVVNGSAAPTQVGGTVTLALAPHPGSDEGSFLTPPADLVSGLCFADESLHRLNEGDLEDGPFEAPAAEWIGLDRQYFVIGLVPDGKPGARCRVRADGKTIVVDFILEPRELAAGATFEQRFALYLGPKRAQELEAVAPVLADVIDYNIWKIPLGFLARPMVVLLNLFHGLTSSWGVAIILLTFIVKLLLFPVTYKSVASMRRMQLLKPELDKLKERFGNDRERMQMEQLKLFREKGVNPLGGCLPMLLQMPVWFALYRTLWTSVDLYQQSFLWLDNLTAKEAFPFLSIAFGALTVVQQRLTPTTMDSQQAKVMMYVMPVMFAVFMIPLPSGLVLYIVVNSVLTIVQQLVINRRLK